MTLSRPEPTRLEDLFDWMEERFLPTPFARTFAARHMIRVEDFLDGEDYVLRAELPGIDPERDVDITVVEGTLTVQAERREENKDVGRSEFHYGSFRRTVALPAGADEGDVRATYKDGILEVRVGVRKPEAHETKHVPIARDRSK